MKKFISVLEAAKLLGMSRVAVVQQIRSGKLKAEKVGRAYIIDRDELPLPQDKKISEEQKIFISQSVKQVVKEYGETLRLLHDA